MGNGPTEDQAEIIQHDQLSQHSEEEPEVRRSHCSGSECGELLVACLNNSAAAWKGNCPTPVSGLSRIIEETRGSFPVSP